MSETSRYTAARDVVPTAASSSRIGGVSPCGASRPASTAARCPDPVTLAGRLGASGGSELLAHHRHQVAEHARARDPAVLERDVEVLLEGDHELAHLEGVGSLADR